MTELPDEVIEANRHRPDDDYLLPPVIVATALGITTDDLRQLVEAGLVEGCPVRNAVTGGTEYWPGRRSIERAAGRALPTWVLPDAPMSARIESLPLHLQFAYHQALAGEWEWLDDANDEDAPHE